LIFIKFNKLEGEVNSDSNVGNLSVRKVEGRAESGSDSLRDWELLVRSKNTVAADLCLSVRELSGDGSGHGGGIELNGVSSSVSLDESVEVPVGALGGGTGHLEVWATSEGDGELGVGEGGRGNRWNGTGDTKLIALLFETETDVDGLNEVGTLGRGLQLQSSSDTRYILVEFE